MAGLLSRSHAAAQHGQLLFKIGGGDGQHYDHRGYQLQHEGGHIQPQGDGIHQAEGEGAHHHADGPLEDAALAQQHLAHEQGGQGNGHHAGADVNADGFLTLGQQAAGETREGVGHAQAHDGGKGGIDRGGADHIGIVAGGADGQAQAGAQKQGQKNYHGNNGDDRHQQLILLRKNGALQQSPGLGEHGLGFVHVQQGGAAHDGDIDGVKPGVDNDARQEAVDAHFRLQQGGDEAGEDSGGHGGQNGQVGMPGNGHRGTHGGAQSEAAVGGQVAHIEHGVAQKQCQHRQRADEAQLQGGLDQR